MLVFGWGSNHRPFPMPDGRVTVCRYRYVHIMWIFRLILEKSWYIADGNPANPTLIPVGADYVKQAYLPNKMPNLIGWRFYLLVLFAGVIGLLAVLAFLIGLFAVLTTGN